MLCQGGDPKITIISGRPGVAMVRVIPSYSLTSWKQRDEVFPVDIVASDAREKQKWKPIGWIPPSPISKVGAVVGGDPVVDGNRQRRSRIAMVTVEKAVSLSSSSVMRISHTWILRPLCKGTPTPVIHPVIPGRK